MKRASKAALLSGLIFPGVGHMVLKQYLRGSVLMLSALVASSIIIRSVLDRALTIVDRINSGDIPADTGAIADMVASSTSGVQSFTDNAALIVLVACWLIGIIDSYRLGVAEEKRIM
jgi:hypothetical protein